MKKMTARGIANWIAERIHIEVSSPILDGDKKRHLLRCRPALLSLLMIVTVLAGQGAVAARVKHSRPAPASQRRVSTSQPEKARRGPASRHTTSRKRAAKRKKSAPVVSRAQMELAQQMAGSAYELGEQLPVSQRVALISRLLYTMRPEIMSGEKKQWAQEQFVLAQRLPQQDAAMRNEAIATAAARVALYDCDRALGLLDTLPSEQGIREDARNMAARLVFATYMQRHGAAGAQTLFEHAQRWGEHGGFPYAASTAALARLTSDEDAAEQFFRQELVEFERRQEGAFGIAEFAELLERAVAMEAISEDAAEEAGHEVVLQAAKLAQNEGAQSLASASAAANSAGAANGVNEANGTDVQVFAVDPQSPNQEAQQRLAEALSDVRAAAPKAYAQAAQQWPGLVRLQPVHEVSPVNDLKIDPELQAVFGELAESIRLHRGPEVLRDVIARGFQKVNQRYSARQSAGLVPDRQSWAFVSLAAYGSPFSVASQLNVIASPYWRAYFLAIAAQQVGEPTRVADPTARRAPVKEEAEQEEQQDQPEE